MLGTLTIVLAAAIVALLGVLAWRERRSSSLQRVADQLDGIVRTGKFTDRVQGKGPASVLAISANRLLEELALKDLLIVERERSLVGSLGGLNEAVAVHRDVIVFANARFAVLAGQLDPQRLMGKSMADLVHPDYTDVVREHLRRTLAGEPGLDRLEIELYPHGIQPDQTTRAELSAVRIDYQGGPALLLTMVEMSPRAASTPGYSRGRSTAWETLDSLGEGVITTDVNGRIDYMD